MHFPAVGSSDGFLVITIAVPNSHEVQFGGWPTAGMNAAHSIHPNLPVHSLGGKHT